MGRTRRQAHVPGNDIPNNRTAESGENYIRINLPDIEESAADRLRHGGAKREGGDEIPERGPGNALKRELIPVSKRRSRSNWRRHESR